MSIYAKHVENLLSIYGDLYSKKEENISKGIDLSSNDLQDIKSSRGYKFLQSFKQKKIITFPELFADYCELMKNQWTWDGTDRLSREKLAGVLDGGTNSGECGILSAALLALWRWPEPFGLDKDGGVLSIYWGTYKEGFYSNHSIGGVFNLDPDVRLPFENLETLAEDEMKKELLKQHYLKPKSKLPLKNWENHQTVNYGGIYYDPSYNTTYKNEVEMQALEVISNKANLYSYQVAKARKTIPLNSITIEAQQTVYFAWISVFGGMSFQGFGPYFDESEVNINKPLQKKVVVPPVKVKKKKSWCSVM